MTVNEFLFLSCGEFFIGLHVHQIHAFDVFGEFTKGGGEFFFKGVTPEFGENSTLRNLVEYF